MTSFSAGLKRLFAVHETCAAVLLSLRKSGRETSSCVRMILTVLRLAIGVHTSLSLRLASCLGKSFQDKT